MTAHNSSPETAAPAGLSRSDNDGITVLTLTRTQARNTLSEGLLRALTAEFVAISADKRVRVVVIAAQGPAFCAGHDMKEMTARRADPDHGRGYFKDLMERCSALMLSIRNLPQPVIAAVEGIATAAGCQMVATCDLAVASKTARFATPGVHIGLFCSTPMVALSRNVSNKHAMEMLLTGELVSADDAYRIGLVNRVVARGKALDQALALARTIASKSVLTVKTGKQAFYRQRELNLTDAYKLTVEVMVDNMMSRDAEEGIGAFIDKRDPRWEDC
jgi:enoyl-CoA hydratase/carnithine racemase